VSVEVEDLVARHLASSPDADVGELIEQARQAFPLRDVALLAESVERFVTRGRGLGRVTELLEQPDVTEIMINGDGSIWLDSRGSLQRADLDLSSGELVVLVERILQPLGLRVDPLSPSVDARLADGSRVNIVVPPVAIDGPTITIRRFAPETLALSAFGPPALCDLLDALVRAEATMLVVGGTGAGKTTLLNALASRIPPSARIVTIEDTAELDLPGEHVVRLEARPPNREGLGEVTIRDLVRNSLRMRPDRLIVGEVRSGEAFDLLLALNTGHTGSLATCHANGALEGLRRLETLALLSGVDVPLEAVRQQMLSAIDVVVHVIREGGVRRVAAVEEVDRALLATRSLWPGDGSSERVCLSGPERS
jgi:pilus assembly protein CpaF